MRRSDLEDLKHFPLFANLGDHDREALASEISVLEIEDGETLFSTGDVADGAMFVVEGVLSLLEPDGDAGQLCEGASLGALSLVVDSRRQADAVADGRVRLFALKRSAFERLSDAAPHTACRLLAAILRDCAELMRAAADDLV